MREVPKHVEIEKVKEVRVEVPVEVVRNVEVEVSETCALREDGERGRGDGGWRESRMQKKIMGEGGKGERWMRVEEWRKAGCGRLDQAAGSGASHCHSLAGFVVAGSSRVGA